MSVDVKKTGGTVHRRDNPLLKLALEMGPLMVFFFANQRPAVLRPLVEPFLGAALLDEARGGIFIATAAFMAAMVVSIVASKFLLGRLAVMPMISAAVVLIFGGLTLWLADDLFIKLKPTIVNALFGTILLVGLLFGRSLLSLVLDSVFAMDAEGWRTLTLRWGLFFFVLAALNEAVWRTQTTDFWVAFKVWGVMPLTILFAIAQVPLMNRHQVPASSSR